MCYLSATILYSTEKKLSYLILLIVGHSESYYMFDFSVNYIFSHSYCYRTQIWLFAAQ